MRVSELRKVLESYPDDFEVVLSSDAEGNSYGSLSGHGNGIHRRFGYEEEFTSWIEEDGAERMATVAESNAVCLWPR